MHSLAFLSLAAAVVPAVLAVSIGNDGITWAPGEQCLTSCALRGFTSVHCNITVPLSETQTCACSSDAYKNSVQSCVQTDCADFAKDVDAEIEEACSPTSSSTASAPGSSSTGFPEVTIADACQMYCATKALDDGTCPIVTTIGDTCTCTDNAYQSSYKTCVQTNCPTVADTLIASNNADCPGGSSNSGTASGTASQTGSAPSAGTSGNAGNGGSPSSTSSSAPEQSSTPPGGDGVRSAVVCLGPVLMALLAVVTLA
ncbi:hypothetical protein BKA62DRAFT_833899 [Auriculariales sp. MPI-PUGE-AT-0066]|nr:hypothetical protein BKA62DRAFT_833899 [Auriculariales sp. MPI-PUGE-AT-0066]